MNINKDKIINIYANKNLTSKEKSKLVFKLLNPKSINEGYAESKVDEKCSHYDRNCKSYCIDCELFWYCFRCHNTNINTHKLNYTKIKLIKCLICNEEQKSSNMCKKCNIIFGKYFCNKCNLWENKEIDIYHCDKCKLCRLGKFDTSIHCDVCNICFNTKNKHKCLIDTFKSNCPVCNEYMFDGQIESLILKCGHSMHITCYNKYIKTNYKCPLCKKTLVDISWNLLKENLNLQKMPEEYNYMVEILCNDCNDKTITNFHFIGHECQSCSSYNTTIIKKKI